MRKDLLIRGAELLEANATNATGMKFDLGHWGSPSGTLDAKVLSLDCGTSGCAMGLFAISGEFASEGLQKPDKATVSLLPIVERPDGVRRAGYGAASALFGIDVWQAEKLFSPDAYNKTKGAEAELAVAKRMRHFAEYGEFDPAD